MSRRGILHGVVATLGSMVHGSAVGDSQGTCVGTSVGGIPPPDLRVSTVPFKLNHDRRHHISRQQHKVTNWPAYEAGLRQRVSLTMWFTDDAVAAWAAEPRTTRGGQDQVAGSLSSFIADGACDQDGIYAARHPEAAVIVPPRSSAVPSELVESAPAQRDRHLRHIAERGRMA
jgi:hypothetical protein